MTQATKHKKNSISFTNILTIAFFSLSFLVLSISGILQILSFSQTQQVSAASKLQVIAQKAGDAVINFIEGKTTILETAGAGIKAVIDSPDKIQEIMSSLLGQQADFKQIILFDNNDLMLANISRFSQNALNQFHAKVQSEMLAEVKEKEKYISSVYYDEINVEPIITIIITVRVSREHKFRLACEINLKFMKELMKNLKVGNTGVAYVVNRKGTLIAYRDDTLVQKSVNLGKLKIVKDFMDNTKNTHSDRITNFKGINGKSVAGTYIPLVSPDWAVVTEIPWEEVNREVIINTILTIIINLVMAGLGGLVGLFIARKLVVPIMNLTKTAKAIAFEEKQLEAELSAIREVKSLAEAFNSMTIQLQNKADGFRKMNDKLTEIINTSQKTIVDLNSTSREIEAAAQEQTSGANEFASGITEVSATLEQLTITAKQITKNVGELVFSSEEVIKLLKESEKQLLNAVNLLEDVGKISTQNASKVNELGNRSNLINEMVETIKEIANKTNILSINASIEASQSGEAGARFSVVAAEIRELSKETIVSAKKAENAAREIQELLNTIIISSESESMKVLGSGTALKSIYSNVDNVMKKINNNYDFTQKIDVSIKQQESGSRQASDTMRQMAEIARQSAETARQTASSVQDIVKISVELDNITKRFDS